MIVVNKTAKLYICAFVHKGEIAKVILKPKENVVDNVFKQDLLQHPGFKARVDNGMLQLIDSPKPLDKKPEAAKVDKQEEDKKPETDKKAKK